MLKVPVNPAVLLTSAYMGICQILWTPSLGPSEKGENFGPSFQISEVSAHVRTQKGSKFHMGGGSSEKKEDTIFVGAAVCKQTAALKINMFCPHLHTVSILWEGTVEWVN